MGSHWSIGVGSQETPPGSSPLSSGHSGAMGDWSSPSPCPLPRLCSLQGQGYSLPSWASVSTQDKWVLQLWSLHASCERQRGKLWKIANFLPGRQVLASWYCCPRLTEQPPQGPPGLNTITSTLPASSAVPSLLLNICSSWYQQVQARSSQPPWLGRPWMAT